MKLAEFRMTLFLMGFKQDSTKSITERYYKEDVNIWRSRTVNKIEIHLVGLDQRFRNPIKTTREFHTAIHELQNLQNKGLIA